MMAVTEAPSSVTPIQSMRPRVFARPAPTQPGISRSASTNATIPIGRFTKNTQRQPCSSPPAAMSSPPTSGPTAVASPTVAPKYPNARARAAPLNISWISPEICGPRIPEANPCTSRATTRNAAPGAIPHSPDATVNAASPTRNAVRRPTMSPKTPEGTRISPKVSA
jgi:hypothetical protein